MCDTVCPEADGTRYPGFSPLPLAPQCLPWAQLTQVLGKCYLQGAQCPVTQSGSAG